MRATPKSNGRPDVLNQIPAFSAKMQKYLILNSQYINIIDAETE